MYEDVLVPTDGSAGTGEAIDHALAVAGPETTVHGLYVVDKRHIMAAAEETKSEVRESLRADGETALSEVRDRADGAGLACETGQREGVPHREILAYAAEEGIDLVVMGTHGRTGREAVALGSTTERVVENDSVPVLVVNIG